MKTYNEIAESIFRRRDKYEEEKKAKKQNALHITAATVCLVVITIISFATVRRNWLKTQFETILPFHSETVTVATSKQDENTTFPTTVTSSEKTTASPTTESSPLTTTSAGHLYENMDWETKSMPGKFPTLSVNSFSHLSAIDESDIANGTEIKYVYPFEHTSETATTRHTSLLLTDMYITYTEPDGTQHTDVVDIYSLGGLSEELALGVKFKDSAKIYPYVNHSYTPETLGEFLDALDYDNTVSYGGIYLPTGTLPVNTENAADIKNYLFSDRSISNIMNADGEPTGECVSISINCPELGLLYKALNIYEDGYITTNLIGYGFSFFVGKDIVNEFLKNSYNITFEEIRALTGTTEPLTTSPTTEPSTTLPATDVPYEATICETSQAPAIAREQSDMTEAKTVSASEYTEATTSDPIWWCGTEAE